MGLPSRIPRATLPKRHHGSGIMRVVLGRSHQDTPRRRAQARSSDWSGCRPIAVSEEIVHVFERSNRASMSYRRLSGDGPRPLFGDCHELILRTEGSAMELRGVYDDRFVSSGAGWRFSHRKVTPVYCMSRAASADGSRFRDRPDCQADRVAG